MAVERQQLSDQLDLTRKLAALTAQMAADTKKIAESYELQSSKIKELTSALADVSTEEARKEFTSFDDTVAKSAKNVSKSLDEPKESASNLQKRMIGLGQQLDKKFPRSAAAAVGALSGLVQGIKNVVAIGRASGSMFTGMVSWIADVSAAIVAIPFKMFQGLIDMAQNMSGMDELRQALENIRKEFGALRGPAAGTVIDVARSMKNFSQTGLHAVQVFGMLHERLDYVRELAVAMGPTFSILLGEFKDNGGALLAYQKGLGLSNETMRDMANAAIATGRRLSSFLNENTKYALELGKAFGIDSKLLSRDMGKALSDVKHFAGATVREITQASVYARKLGVELDRITGTLDTFETFDSAAESAAKLGQSFGVLVDSFELMNAQDPATQVEMLRKQLAGAGVDTANMTRQQLKLLAQTTGLDEATAKMVFSLKNQGTSLSDIQKKGGEVERKQMSQAEAMSRLSDAIERLVRSGTAMQGGFFDVFIKGFLGGVQGSHDFLQIMVNIRSAMQTVYMEGVKLGRVFVQVFPGVKDVLGGLADFFKPAKFKGLAREVRVTFEEFFRDLTSSGGKASLEGLMRRLRKSFFDFFDKESPAGRRLLDGFGKITNAIGKAIAGGIGWVADQVTVGMRFVIDLLSGKVPLPNVGAAVGEGVGFMGRFIGPIISSLAEAWPRFSDAAVDLLKVIVKKTIAFLGSSEFLAVVQPAWPVLAGVLLGPAFGRALLAAGTQTLATSAANMLTGDGSKGFMDQVSRQTAGVNSAASKVPAGATSSTGANVLKTAGAQSQAAGAAIQASSGWGVKDAARLGLKLVAIAGAIAVGGVMLAYSVKKIIAVLGDVDIKRATSAMVAMGGMVLVSIPLLAAIKLSQRIGKPAEVAKGGLIIGMLTGLVGGVTLLVGKMLDGFSPEQLRATGDVMLKMSLVFVSMVPLLLSSVALGALMTGPQGAVIGALALGGFGAISTAVMSMADVTTDIVKTIAALKIDSTFQAKSEAFLGIMQSLQAFADTFVKIAEASRPSFLELITGTGSSFAENVDSITTLVESLIHGKSGAGGLTGIMSSVRSIIVELADLPSKSVEGAKVFGDTMQALVGLVQVMTPPPEFYAAGSDFVKQLTGSGDSFQQLATDVGYYAGMMVGHVAKMADVVTGLVDTFIAIDLPKEKLGQVQAVSSIFSTVASLLKSVVPSPDVIRSFVSVTKDNSGIFSADKEIRKFDSAGLIRFVDTLLDQVKGILPIITGRVLDSIVSAAANLKPSDVDRVKVVSTAFGLVTGLVGSLAEITKRAGTTTTSTVGKGITTTTVSATQGLGEMLTQLGGVFPVLLSGITKVIGQVPDTRDFAARIDATKSIISVLGEVPKLAQAMQVVTQADATTLSSGELSKIVIDLAAYGDFLTTASKTLAVGGIAPALRAVEDMVSAANKLDAALSDGNVAKLNVAAKLQNVAKAVGLGGSAKYTVTNKNVVVQIDLTVTMKADEVERVIIQRKSSVIRDRLNAAQYEGSSKPTPIPGEPSAPTPALSE